MKKSVGILSGLALAIAVATTAGAWYTGERLPAELEYSIKRSNAELKKALVGVGGSMTVELVSLDRHFFSSTAQYRLKAKDINLGDDEVVPLTADSVRTSTQHALIYVDLDHFKVINDTFGHQKGDEVLRDMSQLLSQQIRGTDILCRLGGDEFAVVLMDANDTGYVEKLAKTIIEALSKPYEIDQNTLYIGASIGSAVGPMDGRTVELSTSKVTPLGRFTRIALPPSVSVTSTPVPAVCSRSSLICLSI